MVLCKYLINTLVAILFFCVMEMLLYIKDYNEVVTLSNYISYDIKNKGMLSFYNDKYSVEIREDEQVSYVITYNRSTIFVFEWLKSIKYDGIVY